LTREYNPALEWERTQRRLAAEDRRREAEERRQEAARKRRHVSARQGEADSLNEDLTTRLEDIETLITSTLGRRLALTFESLKRPLHLRAFEPGGLEKPGVEPHFKGPPLPGFFSRLFGGQSRYEKELAAVTEAHKRALSEFDAQERLRLARLASLRASYDDECARRRGEVSAQHLEIDQLEHDFATRDPAAVAEYYCAALDRDVLPDTFPMTFRVAYVAESRQLVVERDLPAVDVIPVESSFRYVKARDSIESSRRPASQIRSLYAGLVARFALRSLNVLAQANSSDVVNTIVLSCFVNTIDPATGHPIRPCLLTVRVATEAFRNIDLAKIDPIACLRGLNGQVSPSPHELRPVRPIVDFNMVDRRFIDTTDVLSALDARPNLAELSPGDFEALITNLFSKMGLETRLTQASRDGGVDCVAWDMRPVVGGKVIVQAKRYKNTVGVSAVRDLYGTVLNEGAAKGILVTTSGYGKSAFEFAKNKPLELLPGSQLLFLLEEHAGVKAKIEFPEDWKDPRPDDLSSLDQ